MMLYNKESLKSLIEKANKEDLELIRTCISDMLSFSELQVLIGIKAQKAWNEGLRGEEYRDVVDSLYREIYLKERVSIIAIRVLNRLSKLHGIGLVYLGKEDDELLMNDFISEFIKEVSKENKEISSLIAVA